MNADPLTPAAVSAALQACSHDRMRRLMRRLASHFDARLREAGLKTTQFSLLAYLAAQGPIRPADLAHAMGIDASTLTRNLKPVAQAGWAEVVAGRDARSRLVRLTPAGRVKLAEGGARWREAQSSLTEQLGAERIAAMHGWIDETLALLPAGED
ncbi:MarR family winged helix-turn-helix transcriptional regulator [Ideonella sp. DXS29W]|uniref:MarR family winged helix-turn-helix transcriptional regulator n=1 Tax=Ideonella lacteola TaxID=2984193 RepID=A0ABU9BUD2_9BURK